MNISNARVTGEVWIAGDDPAPVLTEDDHTITLRKRRPLVRSNI
jgi:hypothetical protein